MVLLQGEKHEKEHAISVQYLQLYEAFFAFQARHADPDAL